MYTQYRERLETGDRETSVTLDSQITTDRKLTLRCTMGRVSVSIHILLTYPAGIFDAGSVLLNQNANGWVRTYVNHNRTVAERISIIGSGMVQNLFRICWALNR